VLAAEVTVSSPDFGHLQPTVDATKKELEAIAVTETPGVAVADTGYWHEDQIDNVVSNGTQVLIPPDAGKRDTPRPGWQGGRYTWMRYVLATDRGGGLYRSAKRSSSPCSPKLSTTQVRQLPTPRKICRALGVAADHRDSQPDEASQAPDRRCRALRGVSTATRDCRRRPSRRSTRSAGRTSRQRPTRSTPRAPSPPLRAPFARHPRVMAQAPAVARLSVETGEMEGGESRRPEDQAGCSSAATMYASCV
jgi:hypothetical protein